MTALYYFQGTRMEAGELCARFHKILPHPIQPGIAKSGDTLSVSARLIEQEVPILMEKPAGLISALAAFHIVENLVAKSPEYRDEQFDDQVNEFRKALKAIQQHRHPAAA